MNIDIHQGGRHVQMKDTDRVMPDGIPLTGAVLNGLGKQRGADAAPVDNKGLPGTVGPGFLPHADQSVHGNRSLRVDADHVFCGLTAVYTEYRASQIAVSRTAVHLFAV